MGPNTLIKAEKTRIADPPSRTTNIGCVKPLGTCCQKFSQLRSSEG